MLKLLHFLMSTGYSVVIRLLQWILIGVLAYLVLRIIRGKRMTGPTASRPSPGAAQMVRCHVCGLHVPQQEAVQAQGRYYCCDDHRRRDQPT